MSNFDPARAPHYPIRVIKADGSVEHYMPKPTDNPVYRISILFSSIQCSNLFFNTVSDEKFSNAILQIPEHLRDIKKTHRETVKYLVENDYMDFTSQHFKEITDKKQSYIKTLASTLEHHVNIKFSYDEHAEYDHKIAICYNGEITKNLEEQVSTFYDVHSKDVSPSGSLVVLASQEDVKSYNPGVSRSVLRMFYRHLVAHGLGYALGLDNPEYETIEENQEHRSVLENSNTLIEADCLEKHRSNILKRHKCINYQTKFTVMDLNALVELYGSGPEAIKGVQHVSPDNAVLINHRNDLVLAGVTVKNNETSFFEFSM